jgi:hypothetical protein
MKTIVTVLIIVQLAATVYAVTKYALEVIKLRRVAAQIRLHKKIWSHFKEN